MPDPADLPSAGRLEGGCHLLPVRVYYEDTDVSGIVYHANYLKFIERGRSDLLRVLGLDHARFFDGPDPFAFTVRRMALEFHKPARIDDALLIETRVAEITGATLVMRQRVLKGPDCLFEAQVTVACLAPTGRPKRLPAEVRAAFAAVQS